MRGEPARLGDRSRRVAVVIETLRRQAAERERQRERRQRPRPPAPKGTRHA